MTCFEKYTVTFGTVKIILKTVIVDKAFLSYVCDSRHGEHNPTQRAAAAQCISQLRNETCITFHECNDLADIFTENKNHDKAVSYLIDAQKFSDSDTMVDGNESHLIRKDMPVEQQH